MMPYTFLRRPLLVDSISNDVKKVESALKSDGKINQKVVAENHQHILRMNGVSMLKCGVTISQILTAE